MHWENYPHRGGSNMRYYTQRLAEYHKRQVAEIPDDVLIPEKYFMGLGRDDFIAALKAYREILLHIYDSICEDPSGFGLVCEEFDSNMHGSVTKAEGRSLKSFDRVVRLLSALSNSKVSGEDGSIILSAADAKPISRIAQIVDSLRQIGFEIFREGDAYVFSFPDNRKVTAAIKAFGIANGCTPQQQVTALIHADTRYFTADGEIEYTPEDVIRLMPDENDQAMLRALVEFFRDIGYVVKTEYQYNPARVRIGRTKSAKESVIAIVRRDAKLEIHARLDNIGCYANKIGALSAGIRERTLSGRNCCHCGYCSGGVQFEYENKKYTKCRIICCGFVYMDFVQDDIDSLMSLVKAECLSMQTNRHVSHRMTCDFHRNTKKA